jgi:hypothetical protein
MGLTPRSYKRDKLLATLRLSGVALSKLLRISGSLNSLIVMMRLYVMFCNVVCLKYDFNCCFTYHTMNYFTASYYKMWS